MRELEGGGFEDQRSFDSCWAHKMQMKASLHAHRSFLFHGLIPSPWVLLVGVCVSSRQDSSSTDIVVNDHTMLRIPRPSRQEQEQEQLHQQQQRVSHESQICAHTNRPNDDEARYAQTMLCVQAGVAKRFSAACCTLLGALCALVQTEQPCLSSVHGPNLPVLTAFTPPLH
jgi:hypothetical protein